MRKFVIVLFITSCASSAHRKDLNYAISPSFKTDEIQTFALIPDIDIPKEEIKRKVDKKRLIEEIYSKASIELMKIPYLDVVDRKDIDKILEEQEFTASGFVGDYAPELGELLGAKIVGYFTVLDIETEGYPVGQGMVIQSIKATVSFKIIDVGTGRILYQSVAESTSQESEYEALVESAIKCLLPLRDKNNR